MALSSGSEMMGKLFAFAGGKVFTFADERICPLQLVVGLQIFHRKCEDCGKMYSKGPYEKLR